MFTVGGYDVEKYAPGKNLTWNDVVEPTYWTLKLKKADIGDTMVLTSTRNAIIDSGTSYLALPNKELLSIVDLLGSVYDIPCTYSNYSSFYACECPDFEVYKTSFPNLTITLSEDNTYEIPYYDFT